VTVFIAGIGFAVSALFSAVLPGRVIFAVLAWPVAIMRMLEVSGSRSMADSSSTL
jgi:hypothetical protein